jgi:hypothetical protein
MQRMGISGISGWRHPVLLLFCPSEETARRLMLAFVVLCYVCRLQANENAALAIAYKDVIGMPQHERQYMRYVHIPNGSHEEMQLTSLALNYVSRGTVIIRPLPIDKTVLRIDIRHYAPQEKDRDEWAEAWWRLQYDPTFSLLLTKDTIKFSEHVGIKVNKVDGDVLKLVSPHIDGKLYADLVVATSSQAPIVNNRYMTVRMLSTIQDAGAFKTIYGGLYYDFVGIKTGAKKGTDEDVMFEQLGVGDIGIGLTAQKIFDRLRSDQRVAVFRSGITGRPRRADFLRTLAGLDSQSIVSVTHDIRQQDIDIGSHPVMNLLNFKDAAREVIFERTNGLHGFALFNGDGKRQDEVPPDIAADHSIPAPHATRLQPAIGCIRCHGKDAGWRVVHNDAKKLLGGLLDVFPNRKADEVDRLAGLYAGNVELKLLPRARDDYNQAILKATGTWKKAKVDQTDIAARTADGLADLWKSYWFDTVDAQAALSDLGIKSDPKTAAKTLRDTLPPIKIILDGRVPEDPRIGALMAGIAIGRSDYDLIFSFLASRKAAK